MNDTELRFHLAEVMDSLSNISRMVFGLAASLSALRLALLEIDTTGRFEAIYAKHYADAESALQQSGVFATGDLLRAFAEQLRKDG